MKKRKILFSESYRADALTWTNGLKEFGDFEIITWELKPKQHFSTEYYELEFQFALLKLIK
jgi:hypothetical protein